MTHFRKKPVVIEAEKWNRHGDHPKVEVYGFRRSGAHPLGLSICAKCNGDMHMKIGNQVMHTHGWVDTLESGHVVCPGDWIIKGVAGEFYPCKPDIFAATYEPANSAPAAHDAAQGREVGMLPEALIPHATEWYRLCERRFAVEKMTISGELAEAIVEAMSATPTTNSGEIGRKLVGDASEDDDVYVGTLYITDRYVEFDMENQPTGMDRLRDKLGAGNFDCVVRRLSRREG